MRTFSLDMIPGGAQTAVACNQFEAGDVWVFALYYDGGRYSIPQDATVSITGTKPDGAAYKIAGSVVDNAVVITVTDQITACAGRSIAEILVESETDGTTLYSANFPLLVEPAAVQGELNPSVIPTAIVDTDGNVYYSAEYIPEVSGGVPTEVRQAMKTLFSKAAYIETGLADEVAVITAWAEATTSITVSPATASVSSASTTAQLSAVTTPAGGAVTWVSSNPTVATVSSTGLVTAVSNGTATIIATSGAVSASCVVTVTGLATLTGITATYTQSGTVIDTDTLNSLKSDLVVTASYDDSSTETITDYTLSGTLSVGTSTITVSYGGYTDTFDVTVSSVPDGYTVYDYAVPLVSNTNASINTGIIFDPTGYVYDYEFSFLQNGPTSGFALFGCRNVSNTTASNDAFAVYASGEAVAVHSCGLDKALTNIVNDVGVVHTFAWNYTDGGDSVVTFDGSPQIFGTIATANITKSTKPFYLLAVNKAGTITSGSPLIQVGEIKMYDQSGNLAYDFIPAQRESDDFCGFYEAVHHEFYGKSDSYVTCGNWT